MELTQPISLSASAHKSIEVLKMTDPVIDLGNLLIIDKDPVNGQNEEKSGVPSSEQLLNMARDNTQYLFNKVWELPRKHVDAAICAQLPECTYRLPREKPIPRPREPTKWERFAQSKGIASKKKHGDRKVYEEATGEWKPRYGYRRGNDDTKDWLIEIPDNKDPYKDYFEERKQNKKERINKNEVHRLRNIASAMKKPDGVPNFTPMKASVNKTVDLQLYKMKPDRDTPSRKKIRNEMNLKLHHAKNATASVGKFQRSLKGEVRPKLGKKRQFASNESGLDAERQHQLELLTHLQSAKPKLAQSKFNAAAEHLASGEDGRDMEGKAKGSKRRSANEKPGSKAKVHRQQHYNKIKKPGQKSVKSKAGKARIRKGA
ncbi:ribosome biogenesis regulatory protein (RRS1) domain-containing protein [Ditylenchus destructor]|uniref:Ribosome biogenesis regulatory protein n=1 Tax=Ditylenchus destructor TaxID=166010 RepID=A0AAD4R7E7_9BILA|nr:ribosome biogenesis regulatory protein (RRS1) domain-containing protein [Ditylenchus destructor]